MGLIFKTNLKFSKEVIKDISTKNEKYLVSSYLRSIKAMSFVFTASRIIIDMNLSFNSCIALEYCLISPRILIIYAEKIYV